jgi:HEAT repeat protein
LAHDATLAKDLRVDAIVAFVQMQHPMAEAMRVPNDLVHDSNPAVQAAARMISGALARAGRPEHPTESEAIDASLLALYRNATDTRDKTELVGALGNSAGSSAIQAIKEGLRDSSSSIRSAAARALRLADGSDVDRLLARAILSDSDPAVRADAIFATRFRHPLASALADALVDAASADKISYVRSDALAVLRQNLAASVRIPEALARIADTDADAGIRRQAKDALATLPPPKSTRP